MLLDGIDVSHHQGSIAWKAVAGAGIKFAFLKASEGVSFQDSRFVTNLRACTDAGIPWGPYHFARPGTNDPVREANHFVKTVNDASPGRFPPLPWVLDIEVTTIGRAATTNWALSFMRRLRELTDRTPLFYTYVAFAGQSLDPNSTELARYPLWIAHYHSQYWKGPTIPRPWTDWVAWQYTSTSKVPGIAGNCDRNFGKSEYFEQGDEDDMAADPTTQILITMTSLNITATRTGVDYWYGRYVNPADLNFDPGKLFRAMAEQDGNPNT